MTLNLGSAYYADGETCVGQNFSHFLPAETDYTIERCFKEQVYPTVPIQDASRHINFNIEPSSYFLDLAETSLEMVLKIVMRRFVSFHMWLHKWIFFSFFELMTRFFDS